VRVAVVGHVEWVEFLKVDRVPTAGAIVHTSSLLAVAAGGGGVAAVQLARWTGACRFYTALGDDELGHRTFAELRGRGVDVQAVWRPQPMRRAITLVDADRERTIIVIGERLVPHGEDLLPWDELADFDAVYVTGGDPGAVRAARRARVCVATTRIVPLLVQAAVELDAVVGSASDPGEQYRGEIVPPPRMVVRTEGARGGRYEIDGTEQRWAAVPAEVTGDTYGAGDTFAAALTLALGDRKPAAEALRFAAERSVEVLSITGPYAMYDASR
jgi:ribokinase